LESATPINKRAQAPCSSHTAFSTAGKASRLRQPCVASRARQCTVDTSRRDLHRKSAANLSQIG